MYKLLDQPNDNLRSIKFNKILFFYFTVNLLTFGGSFMLTWTSPIIPKLKELTNENPLGRQITHTEDSWIGSLLTLGAIVGPYIWGILAGKIGRKNTLLVLSIPFATAYVILAFAKIVELYYFARFFAGLSLGGLYIIIPAFLSEIAEKKMRGVITMAQNVAITASMVFTNAVGPYVSIVVFNLICLSFLFMFFVLCVIFVTDTPFYYAERDQYDKAQLSLQQYRGASSEDVQSELHVILSIVDMHRNFPFMEVMRLKGTIKGLIMGFFLMFFQQFAGIMIILFNTQTIFAASKTTIPADIASIIFSLLAFIAAVILSILIDKVGRRIMLIISACGTFTSGFALATYFYLLLNDKNVDSIRWLPLVSLLSYMSFHGLGYGPLPWVILAEILPEHIKSKLTPFVSSFCWFLATTTTIMYGHMKYLLQIYGFFFMFATSNGFALLFAIFILPETKGKTFKEIQIILNS